MQCAGVCPILPSGLGRRWALHHLWEHRRLQQVLAGDVEARAASAQVS